jgi:hypothetical protein
MIFILNLAVQAVGSIVLVARLIIRKDNIGNTGRRKLH